MSTPAACKPLIKRLYGMSCWRAATHTLRVRTAERQHLIDRTLPARGLPAPDVALQSLRAHNLPRAGDLEPPRGPLIRLQFQLGHSAVFSPTRLAPAPPGPSLP